MKLIRIVTLDNGTSLKVSIEEVTTPEFGNHIKVVRVTQSDANRVVEMVLSQPEAIALAHEIVNEFGS